MPHAASRCILALIVVFQLSGCALWSGRNQATGLEKIQHVVVIYAENRSFDNLYGLFPGADGIANADMKQVDRDGSALPTLPPVWKGKGTDPAFPTGLPNKPFRIDAPPVSLPLSVATRDLVHRYYQNIEQINGGRNDRFAAISDAGGLVMGYYDGSQLPMWKWAREYTLADNFFMAAFGGSYLNHMWLVCACTPEDRAAPATKRAQLDEHGRLRRRPDSPASALDGPPLFFDGEVTPDGYSVNTAQPPYQPSGIPPAPAGDPLYADPARHPLPPQHARTIGDALSEKGISWAWYAGGWNAALADGTQSPEIKRNVIYERASINFQPHHQPFNYFARYKPGSKERERHLRDGLDFFRSIDKGDLPQVAFYKPYGTLNQHPGYADVLAGDQHIAEIVDKIKAGPLWQKAVIIITYDENGGFWDHVAPPKGDRWGPGSRIPAIIISPFAKRGHVDRTVYDTTSILKFIARRFGLEPLPGVRPNVGDLTNAFDFGR